MSNKVTVKVKVDSSGAITLRVSGSWQNVIAALHGAPEELLRLAKQAGLTDKPGRRARRNLSEEFRSRNP